MLSKNLYKFYLHFIEKQKVKFITLFIVSVVVWPFDLVWIPYLNKIFVDRIATGGKDIYFILMPLVWIFGVKSAANVLNRLFDYLWLKFIGKFKYGIRHSLFSYIHQHSYSFFVNNMSGSTAQRALSIADRAETILDFFTRLLVPLIAGMALSVFLTMKISFVLASIFLFWFGMQVFITYLFGPKALTISRAYSKKSADLSGNIIDSILNAVNVKIFSSPAREQKYIAKFEKDEVEGKEESLLQSWKIRSLVNLLDMVFFIIFFFLLMQSYAKGNVTPGDFLFVYGLFHNFGRSASWMGTQIAQNFENIGASQGSLSFLLQPHDIVDDTEAKNLRVSKGGINFNNIDFAYGDKKVIQNLSLHVNPKEKVGIVGVSGAGKSSLVALLLRFYDLDEGTIEIDGKDISKVKQDSLRDNISYIVQEPSLFNRTIFQNIAYGKKGATKSDIERSAQLARADKFINSFPEKYESLVGERGIKLSGGQRQRIAIARAILKSSPILILDEATSALDSETENCIQESLEYLMKDKTVIVIAHRLSTIAKMDRLVIMDKGRVIEEGSHKQLLDKKGVYAKLWKMQADGFLPI